MEEKIIIGKILKPQGINGLLKLEVYIDNFDCMENVKEVYVDNQLHHIESKRNDGKFLYIKFKEYVDRTALDKSNVINKLVYANRKDLKLEEGKFFIVDLLGSDVIVSDKKIGKLEDIIQNSKTDVYQVKLLNGKELLFPLIKNVLDKVDVINKKITLNAKVLEEIGCYED